MHAFALMALVIVGWVGCAIADTLPASVVSGYTVSDNDVTAGSTLEVAKMTQSAKDAGNGTAIFTARGLMFAGALTIVFPANATQYAVPVDITIVNGVTDAAAFNVGYHISVAGALGRGSRLVVQGGRFALAAYSPSFFLYMMGSLEVSDGSTLSVVGATFQLPSSQQQQQLASTLLGSNTTYIGLTVSNHSHVGFDSNVFATVTGTLTVGFYLAVVKLPPTSSILITNFGELLIRNTSLSLVEAVVQSGSVEVSYLYVDTNSTLTITGNSSLTIDGSAFRVTSVSSYGYQNAYFYAMYTLQAPCSVSAGSNLTISNTYVEMTNVTVGGEVRAFALYADQESPITVSGSSAMIVRDTNVTVMDVQDFYPTFGIVFFAYAYTNSAPLNVTGGSVAALQRTTFTMVRWNIYKNSWEVALMTADGGTPISVESRSEMTVSDTSVVAINISTVGGWGFYIMHVMTNSQIAVGGNSTLAITNTLANFTNIAVEDEEYWRWVTYYTISPTRVTDNGVFSIANTHVAVAGDSRAGSTRRLSLMWLAGSTDAPLWVDHTSQLAISSTHLEEQASAAEWTTRCVLLDAESPLFVTGNLSVATSAIAAAPGTSGVVNIAGGISGTGDVYIDDATVQNGNGQIVLAPSMLDDNAPMFHVCDNTIGGSVCTLINGDDYPCAVNISHRVSSCTAVSRTLVPPTPVSVRMAVRTTISSPTHLLTALLNVTERGTTVVLTNASHPCSPVPASEADAGAVNETSCGVTVAPESSGVEIKDAVAEGRIPGVYAATDVNPPSPAPSPPKDDRTPLIIGVSVGCTAGVVLFAVVGGVLYSQRRKRLSEEGAPLYSVS